MSSFVLIVDDDDALAENVAEIINGLAVQIEVAHSRAAALKAAERRDFDVALIDVRLPDGDGISLLEPMRSLSAFTQLVLITGNATIEGAIAAVRGDAFAYVLKPVSPSDLLDTVRRALEQAALYRERERLRQNLELSERRHRELMESMPAFMLALDGSGRITTWNRQLEQVTGYGRAEILGTDGTTLVGADARLCNLPLKGGGNRRVRWSRAEVPGPDGAPLVYAVGLDVTDEEEMLRRMLRAERLAAVGTMAAGLAHEVRNPLNSASLQLAVLDRRLERGEDANRTRPIAAVIQAEIERLNHLVRDFLAFAKPSPLDLHPVQVGELLTAVAELVGPENRAAGITVTVEPAPDLPTVSGDAGHLRQVLLNLTRNALEAIQGQNRLEREKAPGQIILRGRRSNEVVEMEIEDNGPGFSEQLPLFDAFFTTKKQGTGLGLAIAHRIVSDHGGTIRVEVHPGRTRFTVALPFLPTERR